MMRRFVLAVGLLAAAGCSGGGNPATPPGEDRQLNEAADALDANAVDANAVDANDAEVVDEPEGNTE